MYIDDEVLLVDEASVEGVNAGEMVEGIGPQIRDIQQEIDQGIGIESDGVQQVGGDQLELIDELMAESNADLSFGSLNYNGNVAEDV